MPEVRTRFAPSPTGYMHIGGMRTALFNWLWARHTGGKFILRIDDTDRQRNVDEALRPILAAFRWLDLLWDEGPEIGGPHGPYFQSQRGEIYQRSAQRLLAEKKAYRDFETSEEVQRQREAADKEKRPFISSRKSLELSDAEVQKLVAEGRPHVIRFLVPRGTTIALDDVVRGHVEWDTSLIPDPVIMRGDGTPLYNFATVVDDSAMEITHVIRAEEHLSNTPVQMMMHQALGHALPVFAHIPFVTAPGTTKKLSKREIKKYRENPKFRKMFEDADRVFPQIGLGSSETLNPVMVEYYEKIGFLPHAIVNALARIGWSLDDRTEFMTCETIVQNFTLERIVKNPAGLDPDKLYSFQTYWMNQLPLEEKVTRVLPYLTKAGLISQTPSDAEREYVARVVQTLGERLKVSSDILDARDFFVADGALEYDEATFKKRMTTEGTPERLQRFRDKLANVEPFAPGPIEEAFRALVDSEKIKPGDLIHAVRVAVTGKATGPGLFECLGLLGRQRSLDRIDQALARLRAGQN
jgi:glutamyl-tRNA synthetase